MSGTSFGGLRASIQSLAKTTIDKNLKGKSYEGDAVPRWCEEIVRRILDQLADKKFQPFKYMVNCVVLAHCSQDVHTVTRPLWDEINDGYLTEKWSNESMECTVTIWGLKY
jgi:hypothetical protein